MIWHPIRLPCVADFPDLGIRAITGPNDIRGQRVRRYPVGGDKKLVERSGPHWLDSQAAILDHPEFHR